MWLLLASSSSIDVFPSTIASQMADTSFDPQLVNFNTFRDLLLINAGPTHREK